MRFKYEIFIVSILIILFSCIQEEQKYEGRTVKEWSDSLSSFNINMRDAAETALIQIGIPSVPFLLENMKGKQQGDPLWDRCSEIIAGFGIKSIPELVKSLDKAWAVEEQELVAIILLWYSYFGESGIPEVVKIIDDINYDIELRETAIISIHFLSQNPDIIIPIMKKVINDENPKLSETAREIMKMYESNSN